MINNTIEILKSKYGVPVESIKIEDVRIGVFETFINLSGNLSGIASNFIGGDTLYNNRNRENLPFSTGQIKGHYIEELFAMPEDTKITKSLKIAVLNALSSPFMEKTGFRYIQNCDPFDLLDLSGKKEITIVGAFKSYIEKIANLGHRLHVLEFNKESINEVFQKFFVHAEEASSILPKSDIVIITGSSIVNNTLENLLSLIPEYCQVVVCGPSSSFVPDVLFKNKVKILGATMLTRPDEAIQLVGEAATGYNLFKTCAKKICLVNEVSTPT